MIEELLYTQCFNYMNWSGSIKVPSVVQYAKKLSMFVGQYIGSDNVGAKLHTNLYYIWLSSIIIIIIISHFL